MNKKPMYWPIYSALAVVVGLLAVYSLGGFVLLFFSLNIYKMLGVNDSSVRGITWGIALGFSLWGTVVLIGYRYPAELWEAQAYRAAKRQLEAYDD